MAEVVHDLAPQREFKIHEGQLLPAHLHMLLSIPPKCSVSQVVGFIKGKSTIVIARTYSGREQNFTGQHFWARGYFVSTVGRDATVIRTYVQQQDHEDRQLDDLGQGKLFD